MEEYRILIWQWPSSSLITMNKLRFMALMMLTCSCLTAQQQPAAIDLASLSVNDAEYLANHTADGQIHLNLVAAAISSRRMDLIKLCFENQYTRAWLLEPVIQIKDEKFQDEIVLMMLKSKSPFWPNDNPFVAGGIYSGSSLREPFTSTIRRNLPDLVLSNDLISTYENRLKLAGDVTAVIEKRHNAILPPPEKHPQNRTDPQADSPTLNENEKSINPYSLNAKSHEPITSQPQPYSLIWILAWAIGILTFAGILRLLFKGRKQGQ